MNLKYQVLLLLYKYPNMKLNEMRLFLKDVKNEILKAELVSLHNEGLIVKSGSRGSFQYSLSDMGKLYIENAYLKHRFLELKLFDNMLLSDLT